jgi:hypothetical protein
MYHERKNKPVVSGERQDKYVLLIRGRGELWGEE